MKLHIGYALAFAFASITGCAVKESPMHIYTLDTTTRTQKRCSHKSYANRIVQIAYPKTLASNGGVTIAFSYSPQERGYYHYAQWEESLGKLFQSSVIQAIERSACFKAVTLAGSSVTPDLKLESTIYDFSHHIRSGDSYAVVSVGFSLVDVRNGKLLRHRRFTYKEPTASLDAKGYVEAANRALTHLLDDLIKWVD